MITAEALHEGRKAFGRREWAEAYAKLAAADPGGLLTADDLERLAMAAYLSGHDQDSTATWARCYRTFLDRDEPGRAARCAFWLGFGLIQRGETAQGGGWMARASRLVEERGLGVERGYLLIPAGLMSLASAAYQQACDRFGEAGIIADRFHDTDLRALGRLGRGQALFHLGCPDAGAELFDEVMVSVIGGEVSPVVSGIVYCAVIDACQRAFDVRRAYEWTAALSRWCAGQPGLVPYRGQCLVHRSQVLQLHGAWAEAMDAALRAGEHLSEPPHPAVGMAHYQLGELRRLRGDLAGAEAAYRQAQQAGRPPQPGLALVRLAQGHTQAAAAAIDTAVAEAGDPVTLARLLPAFAEIMLAAQRADRARAAAGQLTSIAGETPAPFLAAAAAQLEGSVLLAEEQPRAALRPLRWAWGQWCQLEAPYEAAQTQVLVALGSRAIGDQETAELECEAARGTFAQLGAALDLQRLDELFGPGVPRDAGSTVSPRELQVLRRVARGMTNQEIAGELFISIKTVERHLSNIFSKLDATNRASATASAHERGLL